MRRSSALGRDEALTRCERGLLRKPLQRGTVLDSGRAPREALRDEAPEISGFLGRGKFVSVSARTGNDIVGFVCDWNESGVLIDVRDGSGDATGYELLPWSSIERVSVEDAS